MIIDFHTHVFPEKIAEAAMSVLAKRVETTLKPVHNGHLSQLLENMDRWSIDISVVQPVVTKPSQVTKNNQWAQSIQSNRIISFGGIFPSSPDYKQDIDYLVELGLKGIKLHPEYQQFQPDSIEALRLYDYAISKGLIVLIHGGVDLGMPPPYRATPTVFRNIARQLKGGVVVAAHLGGHEMWDAVERVLVGENIYLDTSMGFKFYSDEQFLRIVRAHGAEKVLFASDSPWSDASYDIERIKNLPLSIEEKDSIFYKNATRVLGLKC